MFDKFEVQQIWSQLVHFTEGANAKTLQQLEKIISDSAFEEELELLGDRKGQPEEGEDGQSEEAEDEEGEEQVDDEEGEQSMEDAQSKSLKSEEFDDFMDDFEERQQTKKDLKMPEDLLGNEDDLNDYGDDFDGDEEGEAEQLEQASDKDEDIENEVFALARENKEMKGSGVLFANQEMLEKIQKIEDEMMDEKKWTMKGEV